ncbi:MAG: hypothetical protein OJF62_001444 [Pseudolabrys sp.]|nr:hypothetical protein [Pseudolabrys sp.]
MFGKRTYPTLESRRSASENDACRKTCPAKTSVREAAQKFLTRA